ncbi:MAG: hypothetical protein WD690_17550 [Vicinamibacterales bacterium]
MTADPDAFTAPTSRAHKILQDLMGMLDRALPDDSQRQLKATLWEQGTSACAFARLGADEAMEQDLRAMQAATAAAKPEGEKSAALAELRRLIDASLAEVRGH